LYLIIVVLCWLLIRRGYERVQQASEWVGPGLLIVATVSLALLVYRFGVSDLWHANVAPSAAFTGDRRKALCYSVEFGLTFSLAWWPFLGGLYRLVKHGRHTINPFMLGTLCGAGFCSVVAALGAVHEGAADPVVWMIRLAGPVAGKLLVALVLLM